MNAEEAKDFYLDRFAGQERGLVEGGREWTRDVRRDALARFGALGFPTTHDEEWRYTNIAPIVTMAFAASDGDSRAGAELIAEIDAANLADHRLVFLNGRFSRGLSRLEKLPNGVIAGSLAAAMSDNRAAVEPYWARSADYHEHVFVALNTAMMEDGAFLFVPERAVVDAPIHFLFIATAPAEATASHPRSLIVLARGSQATVVETYLGSDRAVYLANAVTEIALGENAVLDHYKVQRESAGAFHVAAQQARLERGSTLSSHSIALGGALVRNEVNAALDGEGGDCTLNGLYVTAGKQHVDNHTRIDHVKPHCTSREVYKGIMSGKSRGVFNGKIYVHKAAEKTDARQTNKNLLLSEEAWIDTKPQLEIYNNDVKCSHGSTIGQLDEDALFYLRARGIDAATAIGLLTQGFAADITGRIKNAAVATWVEKLLVQKLKLILMDNGKL
ncbi:MAG TPA: Fe-S cluster assembly protein SufD [Candidatus Binatia bacterium]|jgi:Fe-S cluster assembly protein SufD